MKTLRYLLLSLTLMLSGGMLRAQLVPAGLSDVLNHTLDSMRLVTGAKSLSAAIQFSNEGVWAHAKGISSVFPDVSVTAEDAYLIGSVTRR